MASPTGWGGLRAAAVVSVSLLFALCAAEAALHLLDIEPMPGAAALLRDPGQRIPHRNTVLASPRLLNPSWYDSDPDRLSILAIGDSFTEGPSLKEAWPAVLERSLERSGPSARVINAGIAGSGPGQQLQLLDSTALQFFDPDIVIWAFYANDVADALEQAAYGIEDGRLAPLDTRLHWMYIRQSLAVYFPVPLALKRHSRVFHLALRATEMLDGRQIPPSHSADPERWSLEKLELQLDRFEELAAERGFEYYLVLIAPQASYLMRDSPESKTEAWDQELRWTGELRKALEQRRNFLEAWFPEAEERAIFLTEDEDPLPWGNRHMNPAGYALIGDWLAQRIQADRQ